MSSKYVVLEWSLIRDKSMTMQEKLIYSEIKQLDQLEFGCIANNEHFARLLDIKKPTVSRTLSSLENKGFIKSTIRKGSRNFDRKITINKMLIDYKQNVIESITKCYESKDNKTINKTIEGKLSRFSKPNAKQINDFLKENNNEKAIDADYFVDYYESKDWMVGKSRMKDWKATVRNWIRRDKKAKPVNKTAIQSEINARISRGADNTFEWKSNEAKAIFERMRLNGGIPWHGDNFTINKIIQDNLCQ